MMSKTAVQKDRLPFQFEGAATSFGVLGSPSLVMSLPLPGALGAEPTVAGVRGCYPRKNGNWNKIWCILAHFCFKTAAIQCFTFCEQKL